MGKDEAINRIKSGNFSNRYGFDLQTLVNVVGTLGEMLRNGYTIAPPPRVMTPEEVNALDWDYCYLEQKRLPGNEYRRMLGEYIMTCVTWPSITAAKLSQGMDNYGKTWRCWTSRPTDAQREAEAWS